MSSAGLIGWKRNIVTLCGLAPAMLVAVAGAGLLIAVLLGRDVVFHAPPLGDINAQTLIGAVRNGDIALVDRLIRAGIDINGVAEYKDDKVTDNDIIKATALYLASGAGNDNLVRLLLYHGAKPSVPPYEDAVCAAARMGRTEVLKLLHKAGATSNPASRCRNGKTPLSSAQSRGHRQSAEFLRSVGASADY